MALFTETPVFAILQGRGIILPEDHYRTLLVQFQSLILQEVQTSVRSLKCCCLKLNLQVNI